MEFETVIGLEVHLQLATKSKIFATSSAAYGGAPNEYIDPVTLGLPGSLPVLNKRVVEYGMMMGLAVGCQIRRENRFARKHYFYPDLPKGYQISQYEEPICEQGHVEISLDGVTRTIGITRIHMEEDAGKNIHDTQIQASLIDLNRAGVPLLEIVSEPDLRSPAEAAQYLKTIRQIARYLRISDGNMEEGSLRCDANISLRKVGSVKFGTRTEIKNLNSFKFVQQALEYEVARQMSLLRQGKEVIQETLTFDSATGATRTLRSKEQAAEYRYFPDPDLPPLVIEESWIRSIQNQMPKLPQERAKQFTEALGLSAYDASILTAEREIADFYEEVLAQCNNPKAACNWLTSELFGLLNKAGLDIKNSPVSAKNLGALLALIDNETVSGKLAKIIFEEMFATGKDPQSIIAAKGLKQITNDDEIRAVINTVLEQSQSQVTAYLGGKETLFGFFVGQVMKATKGTASPKKVNDLLAEELARRKQ